MCRFLSTSCILCVFEKNVYFMFSFFTMLGQVCSNPQYPPLLSTCHITSLEGCFKNDRYIFLANWMLLAECGHFYTSHAFLALKFIWLNSLPYFPFSLYFHLYSDVLRLIAGGLAWERCRIIFLKIISFFHQWRWIIKSIFSFFCFILFYLISSCFRQISRKPRITVFYRNSSLRVRIFNWTI